MSTNITAMTFLESSQISVNLVSEVTPDNATTLSPVSMDLRSYGVFLDVTPGTTRYLILIPWSNIYLAQQSVASGSSPTSITELAFSESGSDIHVQDTSNDFDCQNLDIQDHGVFLTRILGGNPYLDFSPWSAIKAIYQEVS